MERDGAIRILLQARLQDKVIKRQEVLVELRLIQDPRLAIGPKGRATVGTQGLKGVQVDSNNNSRI